MKLGYQTPLPPENRHAYILIISLLIAILAALVGVYEKVDALPHECQPAAAGHGP